MRRRKTITNEGENKKYIREIAFVQWFPHAFFTLLFLGWLKIWMTGHTSLDQEKFVIVSTCPLTINQAFADATFANKQKYCDLFPEVECHFSRKSIEESMEEVMMSMEDITKTSFLYLGCNTLIMNYTVALESIPANDPGSVEAFWATASMLPKAKNSILAGPCPENAFIFQPPNAETDVLVHIFVQCLANRGISDLCDPPQIIKDACRGENISNQ